MDFSPAETSGNRILLLSDSGSQPSNSNSNTDVSTDNSTAATPQGTGNPTGSVVIPSHDHSGTILACPVWDQPAGTNPVALMPPRGRRIRHRELPPESPSTSTDTSRAETETEGDSDGDIDMDRTADSERMPPHQPLLHWNDIHEIPHDIIRPGEQSGSSQMSLPLAHKPFKLVALDSILMRISSSTSLEVLVMAELALKSELRMGLYRWSPTMTLRWGLLQVHQVQLVRLILPVDWLSLLSMVAGSGTLSLRQM